MSAGDSKESLCAPEHARQRLLRCVEVGILRELELIDDGNQNGFRPQDLQLAFQLGAVEGRIGQDGLLLTELGFGISEKKS